MEKRVRTKAICINYVCLLYAVLYPYFYEAFHRVSLRTFDMRWQFLGLGLLFVLAVCMVALARQDLGWAAFSNPFVFAVLVYCRYRVLFVLNRMDFVFLSVLVVLLLLECGKRWKRRQE